MKLIIELFDYPTRVADGFDREKLDVFMTSLYMLEYEYDSEIVLRTNKEFVLNRFYNDKIMMEVSYCINVLESDMFISPAGQAVIKVGEAGSAIPSRRIILEEFDLDKIIDTLMDLIVNDKEKVLVG